MGKNNSRNKYLICISILLTSFFVFVFAAIFTQGQCFNSIFFNDILDTFMDFFNPIIMAKDNNPYGNGMIYPAFAEIFYSFFRMLIPLDVLSEADAVSLRNTQIGTMLCIFYLIISMLIIFVLLKKIIKDSTRADILCVLILISSPFLYAVERANIIFVSLIFLLLFVLLKDSENKACRELSLFFLAASAAIKIYPAVFGAVLLKEKRYKEAIRCALYGVLISIIPFFFYGGVFGFKLFIGNMLFGMQDAASGIGFNMSIFAFVKALDVLFGMKLGYLVTVLFFITIFSLTFILSKRAWEQYLVLSLACIMIPSFSYTYTLIFLIVPLAEMLKSTECTNYITICMILVLVCFIYIPTIIPIVDGGSFSLYLNNIISQIALVVLSVSVFTKNILLQIRNRK